jgi:hypothetical protein
MKARRPLLTLLNGFSYLTFFLRLNNIIVEKGVGQVGDKLAKAPVIKQGASFFADYRKFMDRGNVIDLAVAVVVGMC